MEKLSRRELFVRGAGVLGALASTSVTAFQAEEMYGPPFKQSFKIKQEISPIPSTQNNSEFSNAELARLGVNLVATVCTTYMVKELLKQGSDNQQE